MSESFEKYVDSLSAVESLEWAISHCALPEGGCGESHACEALVISRALSHLKPMSSGWGDFAQTLARVLRAYFVQGGSETRRVEISKKAASVMMGYVEDVEVRELAVSALEISAAVMRLMKHHETLEYRLFVLDEMSKTWPEARRLERLVLAFEPCEDLDVISKRLEAAGIPVYLSSVIDSPWGETLWVTSQFSSPSEKLCMGLTQHVAAMINAEPTRFPEFLPIILEAPAVGLRQIYASFEALPRQLMRMAVSKHRSMVQHLEIADFESWLDHEVLSYRAFCAFLNHESLCGASSGMSSFLLALLARENGDENWAHSWIRSAEFGLPAMALSFWNTPESSSVMFEMFWRAEACRVAGCGDRAIEILESSMSSDVVSSSIWLLLADICIDCGRLGQAEHAIAQAERDPVISPMPAMISNAFAEMTPSARHLQVQAVSFKLGRAALCRAKSSPVVEASLLELAIRHGDAPTAAEAALCAFDGKCEELDGLMVSVFSHGAAFSLFLERLVGRRDMTHLDGVYHLCVLCERECGRTPEFAVLEALSRLDDFEAVATSLRVAMRGLERESDLFWSVAELWIEVQCTLGAIEEAVYGLAEFFGAENPRAMRALMFLMTAIPKGARSMLQSALMECLGVAGTQRVLARLKSPPQAVETLETPCFDVDEVALWLMPLAWQMMYRASRLRLKVSRESTEKDARRRSVLAARGVKTVHHEETPAPAEWIHRTQPRASDAFKN